MRLRSVILLLLIILLSLVPSASAVIITPDGLNATQLGGAYQAYTFANGDDKFEIYTLVPLTVQDLVYPLEFWYGCYFISWALLIIGILLTSKKDHVPSLAITACGLLAFGGFLICAMMLPYAASMLLDVSVTHNVDKLGVSTGNNTIYVTQVADYRASPIHTYICWGLSIAGFVEFILGALSFIGYFHRKGIRDASNGKYIESDIDDGAPPIKGKY